jgi:hypothetical protein
MRLCQARIRLEREGLNLFCYGSNLNVYPSGRCRDTGLGLEACRLKMGKKSEMSPSPELSQRDRMFTPGNGHQAEEVP